MYIQLKIMKLQKGLTTHEYHFIYAIGASLKIVWGSIALELERIVLGENEQE